MPALNFKEITEAHIASGQQDKWEQFTEEFLSRLGFRVVDGPDRGSDEGKDLIVIGPDPDNPDTEIRWLVSCKHKAHSGASVTLKDELDIRDRVEGHDCQGFLGVYSRIASSGLKKKLSRLPKTIRWRVIHDEEIEAELLRDDGDKLLAKRYFPRSFEKWEHQQPRPLRHLLGDLDQVMNPIDSPYQFEIRRFGHTTTIIPYVKSDFSGPMSTLDMNIRITGRDEEESAELMHSLKAAIDGEQSFLLKSDRFQIEGMSSELQPFFADPDNPIVGIEISKCDLYIDVALTVDDSEGGRRNIDRLRLRCMSTNDGVIVFSNQGMLDPLILTLTANLKTQTTGVHFSLQHKGIRAESVINALLFVQSLSRGGWLRIDSGDWSRRTVISNARIIELAEIRRPLFNSEFGPQTGYVVPSEFIELLQMISYIAKRTGQTFTLPDRDLCSDDFDAVSDLVSIIKNGRLLRNESVQCDLPLNRDGARAIIQLYEQGKINLISFDRSDIEIDFFGAKIPLGPSRVSIEFQIEDEQIMCLRNALEANRDDEALDISISSVAGSAIVEEYSKWMPLGPHTQLSIDL